MTPLDEVIEKVRGEMREVILRNLEAPPRLLLIHARSLLHAWADAGSNDDEADYSMALQLAAIAIVAAERGLINGCSNSHS